MDYTNGYLELIIGPMFAGKTSKLIELTDYFNKNKVSTLVIGHCKDTRYSFDKISSHDKMMVDCLKFSTIENFLEECDIDKYNVVLVDEGQFFDDLDLILELVDLYKKHVYIFGLDGDFNRQKFGKILDLIPYCDKVTKLHSICSKCRKPGLFSKRLVANQEQTLVGTCDEYTSLCRNCYLL